MYHRRLKPYIEVNDLMQIWKYSLSKIEETLYTVPQISIFELVPGLMHFISKYFAKKKRKSTDQRKTFISVDVTKYFHMKRNGM